MSQFPPDFAIEYDQQIYRPLGIIPHTKIDGSETRLIEWATNCPSCGVEFITTTPMIARAWRRRCDGCKNPHRGSVRSERKRFRRQMAGLEP